MKVVKIIGGLGNQMCQFAFGESLRFYTGDKVLYDVSEFSDYQLHNGFELEKIFNVSLPKSGWKEKLITKKVTFKVKDKFISLDRLEKKLFGNNYFMKSKLIIDNFSEKENSYCKDYLKNYPNSYYMGLFHSYKYYIPFEKEIKSLFKFKKIKDKKNLEIIKLIKNTNSVSIHVRRGDYLNKENESLNIIDLDYYHQAINLIKQNVKSPNYFVFSNDINWCKEKFSFLKNVYYIDWNQGENSYKDMYLMSLCKNNIIVNSTFSWWAAYLNNNENKIVISPKFWKKNVLNTEDRCPKEWIKI